MQAHKHPSTQKYPPPTTNPFILNHFRQPIYFSPTPSYPPITPKPTHPPPQLKTFTHTTATLDTTAAIRTLEYDNTTELYTKRGRLTNQIRNFNSECESLNEQLAEGPAAFISHADKTRLNALKEELDYARYRERTANGYNGRNSYFYTGRTRPARRAIKNIQRDIDSINQKAAIQYNQQKKRCNPLRAELVKTQNHLQQLEREIENRKAPDHLTHQPRRTQFLIQEIHLD
ncbi:MAG: hypothetical protein ACI4QD_09100 [Kiritimatiellia bacterium]